jgi:hypothetical protein
MPEERDNYPELAKLYHENHLKWQAAAHASIISFGTETIKSASLINGGSAAAILAFVSQSSQRAPGLLNESWIRIALLCFVAGLLCSGTAAALSYLSQCAYRESSDAQMLISTPPFIESTARSKHKARVGDRWRASAVLLLVLSFCFSIIGFCMSGAAINPTPAH